MEEDYSVEYGKEANNNYWRKGKHTREPTFIENYRGEGYYFYCNIIGEQQTKQKLEKLRRSPSFLHAIAFDAKRYYAIYVLPKEIKNE